LDPDFVNELKNSLEGEFRDDSTTRLLYSTDASLYQIEPLGVVFPKTCEDLAAAVEVASRYQVPILPRGSGSSLAGQAVGQALILDTSRYLNHIGEIDPETRQIDVEPGVILSALNKYAGQKGLMFGPDPASAERATLGGSIANNASGAHSIQYGMCADHLVSVETILSDGRQAVFQSIPLEEASRRANSANGVEANLYSTSLRIRRDHGNLIQNHWPKVWRRASGYNLNYLLPWSPTQPRQWPAEGIDQDLPYPPIRTSRINLAPLFAGSEGTLGVMKTLKLQLVPRPAHTILGVLFFPDIPQACDAVPEILEYRPSAIELIPGDLIRLARSIPAYIPLTSIIPGEPAAMLVVEFSGEGPSHIQEQARQLGEHVLVAQSPQQQKQIWDVRKMGLGILNSLPGDAKPIAFIEDLTVPVEHLGDFVREIQRIAAGHGTTANYYGHASVGCLHIRPIINLKSPGGIKLMRQIAEEAVAYTIQLGGSASGEHGQGISRSEWLEQAYGPEMVQLFRSIKSAADPHGILNPGKILDAYPMDTHLRYDPPYHPQGWTTLLDFSSQASFTGAVEMCNGAGVCRKEDGVMCPSYQATREEMYSTRGRANLLRAMLSGKIPSQRLAEQVVYQALELCLACKGCKAECPSAVDMAKLKYEFTYHYFQTHRRRMRDYLFGYIGNLAPLGSPFSALINPVIQSRPVRRLLRMMFGLASERRFPTLAPYRQSLSLQEKTTVPDPQVLFLSDAFSRYFHPETERCARSVLEAAGLRVCVLPILGAGRTMISKGLLPQARNHAKHLVAAITQIDPEGKMPLVGVEPSEVYSLRDEYLDLFPGDEQVKKISDRSWMIDEFLIRPDIEGRVPIERLPLHPAPGSISQVLLHGHCYQKARPPADDGLPVGMAASQSMLRSAGYQVQLIETGCCGMAGAFGYEAEHYEVSMQVAEISLLPRVRNAPGGNIIAASGTSCRSQIEDGAQIQAVHPICLIEKLL
jgi:FAD/FMN-containing dehydrogenase/Fe-S oxidoreductase